MSRGRRRSERADRAPRSRRRLPGVSGPQHPSPVPCGEDVVVAPGPLLLAGVQEGPGLAVHRRRHGLLVPHEEGFPDAEALAVLAEQVRLRGRGGAGFPFATKLRRVAERGGRRRPPVVVVNAAEGEPASHKDAALLRTVPHLVLDGAAAAAHAVGAHEVHVVVPAERHRVVTALAAALAERRETGDPADVTADASPLRWQVHVAAPRFVAGQESAVLELIAGREGLPVHRREPAAVRGVRGRPTLLSNAETFAHVGLLALHGAEPALAHGTAEEPGTTLVTTVLVTQDGCADPVVREVPFGTSVASLLPVPGATPEVASAPVPVLVGGFHGAWLTAAEAAEATVSSTDLARFGAHLGAGVLLVPGTGVCPLGLTDRILGHLAEQSAGRCGPCVHGLGSLATAFGEVTSGREVPSGPVAELAAVVVGRGACAHPDGTSRLVVSALQALADEIDAHSTGSCPPAESRPFSSPRPGSPGNPGAGEEHRWAS
ncbi:NADH-ubiquinone oxidoreductase-F iron-sulfur binding region domain-containing protein [Nocardioides sp. GY 10127]|uniref:NADH-ubiquinone oxidoreductase-F iron-sulfur binding region domain-containing protein n=1 Tax=Nocardioides sp. GY 10127 TaxID=2569762 RepID=UPI0010A824CC|nr:NADH-ubiquinone oxidoreductase-F iron-sulfur binding region domain-containing protein [Nocardioides sp. GY 10127]TIC84459.1 hypothetical protein E8D37_06775 [Nocardioides sp. GY 10127]